MSLLWLRSKNLDFLNDLQGSRNEMCLHDGKKGGKNAQKNLNRSITPTRKKQARFLLKIKLVKKSNQVLPAY